MKKNILIICLLFLCWTSQLFAAPCGDVNSDGLIDIVDALVIAQYYVEYNPENFDEDAADVDGNGSIDILDALLVARYYVGLITELPGCSATPTPTPTEPESITYELQAENEKWSSGAVDTNHDGYTGTGFVNTDNAEGEWIEWSFDLSADSTADCVFRYACQSDARSMDLSINGSAVTNLGFPAPGAWNTWAVQATDTLTLNAGLVTIRLTATTSGGAPNMDKMDITLTGGKIVAPTETPDPTPTPVPTATPEGWTPPPYNEKLMLWYEQPASNWDTQALPIGNGRLGGMFFGEVSRERIQFNDKTLWTGSPSERGSYQNFGDLNIDFSGHSSGSQYRRELNIGTAIARVMYNHDGTEYTREYFCSYPDDVMVMHFTSDGAGNLNITVRLDDAHSGTMSVSGNRITMTGKLTILSYEAQVMVINNGGTQTGGSDRISVSNADAITVILAGGTNYDPKSSSYYGSGLHDRITSQMNNASSKSYDELKSNHLADFQGLFNRVILNLDDTKSTLPTDQLLENYKNGDYDPYLEVLYFQFGRYLMLGCSRPGLDLPSNLQGLWNDSNSPAWQCDLHSNINVQMNYWPADNTNLSECHEPFLNYIYNEAIIQSSWSNMASSMNCRGWTLKTQNNIFAYSNYKWHRPANAWYCMHIWDHYLYTLDSAYLSNTAYPVMKSACEFWFDRLIEDSDGTLVAPDEWSPEHGPWENGVTYAQNVIWDLFTNTIRASEILNIDSSFRTLVQEKLNQLDPGLRVGSWGQFREWKYTNDSQSDTHRHVSHLLGLYPGKQVSPWIDTKYSDAAKVSLNARGDKSTGWATAQRIACWARLLDGNRALSILRKYLLKENTVTNLFDTHPPLGPVKETVFQIDGNFGGTAGIVEMLLQSQLGEVVLLPALPDAWPKGNVKGLVAKGAFEVDIVWEQGALIEATIKSKKGGTCTVKNNKFTGDVTVMEISTNQQVSYTKSGDTITFNTIAGQSYLIY